MDLLTSEKIKWLVLIVCATSSMMGWKTRIASFMINDLPVGLPDKQQAIAGSFLKLKNYPNPFQHSTVISWQLTTGCQVVLKVYDFTGRELKTLVDCEQAKGEYKVELNAEGLPAGIYFYQLQVNENFKTKKMIHVK